jgi:hypothetical protein
MTTNNCPPTVTLNTSPFVIGVTIKDQFGTIVKGAILEDNQFDVILTDSGCAITDDSNSTIVDYLTGKLLVFFTPLDSFIFSFNH